MNLTIDRQQLLSILLPAVAASESKSSIPVLQTVRLKLQNNRLSITGTDLDTTFSGTVDCRGENGEICLSGKKLLEIAKSLSGEIQIKVKDEKATISSKATTFKMLGMGTQAFPDVDRDATTTFSIEDCVLVTGLRRTVFATCNDETRYALHGVLFQIANNKLILVGTDGHRLAYFDSPTDYQEDYKRIIPKKSVNEILKLSDGKTPYSVGIETDHITFTVGNKSITTRLLNGEFPNYEMVLRLDYPPEFQVKRSDFLTSIAAANILADERSHTCKITFKDSIGVAQSQSSDNGESEIIFNSTYAGEELIFGVNAAYLIAYLTNETSEEIHIAAKDSNLQWRFSPTPNPSFTTHHVIMPLRV